MTPIQRIAVIAICLALTVLIVMLLGPWIWTFIVERLPIVSAPALGTAFWLQFPAMTFFT